MLLFFTAPVSPSSSPDRYTKSLPSYHKPREYLELGLARPLPSDFLVPSCSKQILRHSFANTINIPPFSTRSSAPSDCLSPLSDCLDFGLFRPFRSVSVAGRYDPFRPIRSDSARISPIRTESQPRGRESARVVEKKKETRGRRGRTRHRSAGSGVLARRAASDAGAAPQTASPCFPAADPHPNWP